MTPEQHPDTEVQRILALKRHEQPPPAFFQGFSNRVIEGIHSAGPAPRPTLRQRLSVEFYGVPIYICAAGVLVCGLLAGGLIASLRVGPAKPDPLATTSDPSGGAEPVHALVPPTHSAGMSPATVQPLGSRPIRASLAPAETTGSGGAK